MYPNLLLSLCWHRHLVWWSYFLQCSQRYCYVYSLRRNQEYPSLFYFCFLKVGVWWLQNVVLVAIAQQHETTYIYMYSLPLGHCCPFRSPQCINQISLCYTVGFHQLSILYTVLTVYMCESQCLSCSHPLSPLLSIYLFFNLCFYFCFANMFIFTTFLTSTYVFIYDIYFSDSVFLHLLIFLAVLGLHCCGGSPLVAVMGVTHCSGFSCCRAQASVCVGFSVCSMWAQ